MVDLEVTFGMVALPANTSGTVTVHEDTSGNGSADNTDSATLNDGQTAYTLTGFDGSGDVWVEISLDNSDHEVTAEPTESLSVEVVVTAPTAPSNLSATIQF